MIIAELATAAKGKSGEVGNNAGLRQAVSANHIGFDGRVFSVDTERWNKLDIRSRTLLCQDVLRNYVTVAPSASKLIWHFSGVIVDEDVAQTVLTRWEETNEPPVDRIIAISTSTIDQNRFETRGLAAFTGYESGVVVTSRAAEQDALRDLFRIARFVLLGGTLDDRKRLIGVRGPIAFEEDALITKPDYHFDIVPIASTSEGV